MGPLGFCTELGRAHAVARSSPNTPPDFFNVSQALFACLSVIIGLLTLIVGLLQLRRYRKRHVPNEESPVFELEAGYSRVSESCIFSVSEVINYHPGVTSKPCLCDERRDVHGRKQRALLTVRCLASATSPYILTWIRQRISGLYDDLG
jgi:hypothetical protein